MFTNCTQLIFTSTAIFNFELYKGIEFLPQTLIFVSLNLFKTMFEKLEISNYPNSVILNNLVAKI